MRTSQSFVDFDQKIGMVVRLPEESRELATLRTIGASRRQVSGQQRDDNDQQHTGQRRQPSLLHRRGRADEECDACHHQGGTDDT